MGFKLREGEKIHLPALFNKSFTRIDYVPPGIERSKEDVLASIDNARAVFRLHAINVRKGSSLDQLLSRAAREIQKNSGVPRRAMELQYVIAMVGLILGLADEEGVKAPLERIAQSEMDPMSAKPSQGKDAAWELSCLSSLKIGAMKVRVAEPDIVTDLGEGDYGIACKKVYSENSVEKCVKKGVKQIADAKMPGLIALNIDELLIPPGRIMFASDQDFQRAMLQGYATEFLERHNPTLEKYSRNGACDGYIISATRVALLHSTGRYSHIGVNVHVPMGNGTDPGAIRLDLLAQRTSNADGLEDWVAKVGGKTFGL
ncbi:MULTISPECIES: hypothetical protein [Pseudomonas]|uniref:hypothetical protein n=1 Tax=Pseudomonas TaxID=286 RepID=UPI000FA66344